MQNIVQPGDAQYAELSRTFTHQGSPAMIVRCADAREVAAAVALAGKQDLVVSVRSGGHSGAGFSTNDGGLVIDLSAINHVDVRDGDVVAIGTGATWGEVADALAPYGLAISSGDTSTVGVGGLMLGGGIGWMVRKHGLALDHLVAVEIVTADGRVLRASADEHPDLFWAVRGGGGNVGVVTTFEVRARRESTVTFGRLMFPAAEAAAVLKGWRDHMRTASEELTTTAHLLPAFGEEAPPMLSITLCHTGDATGDLAALTALGTLVGKDVATMPYMDALEAPSEFPPGWLPMLRNRFVPQASDELIDTVLELAGRLPMTVVELRALGGAMSRVPAHETAFAHRDAEMMVLTAVLGTPADHVPLMPAFEALWEALEPHTAGAYSNFLSTVRPLDVAAAYPAATLERLRAIKRAYDPDNLFSQNVTG